MFNNLDSKHHSDSFKVRTMDLFSDTNPKKEYHQYLLNRYHYYSDGYGLSHDVDNTEENVSGILDMYCELKFSHAENQQKILSKNILEGLKNRYNEELIAVILEDMFRDANEQTERWLAEKRDIDFEKNNDKTLRITSKSFDESISAVHKLRHTTAVKERSIIEKTIYKRTLEKYGITEEETDILLKKAVSIYGMYAVDLMLDMATNMRNLMDIVSIDQETKKDSVLDKDVIINSIKYSARESTKNILLFNKKGIYTRINFLNWYNSECKECGAFKDKKPINDKLGFVNTIMWDREFFFERFRDQIDCAFETFEYSGLDVHLLDSDLNKKAETFNYSKLFDAYKKLDGYDSLDQNEKLKKDIVFKQSALNVIFGEPTLKEISVINECYNEALRMNRIAIKYNNQEVQTEVKELEPLTSRRVFEIDILSSNDNNIHKTPVNNKRRKINKDKEFEEYINDVKNIGIECECEIVLVPSNSVPIRMAVFNAGGCRICEPIGTENRQTYVALQDETTNEFIERISKGLNEKGEIKKDDTILGFNHLNGKDSKGYIYCPNRILVLAEYLAINMPNTKTIEELIDNVYTHISSNSLICLDEVQERMTNEIYNSQLGEASKTIARVIGYGEQLKDRNQMIIQHLETIIEKNSEEIGLTTSQLNCEKKLSAIKKIRRDKERD